MPSTEAPRQASRRGWLRRAAAAPLLAAAPWLRAASPAASTTPAAAAAAAAAPKLASLDLLSLERLRERSYAARFEAAASLAPRSAVLALRSDGLRQYARVDLPEQPRPAGGWPVLLWAHGWVGADGAPRWDFEQRAEGLGAAVIAAFVAAGCVVVTPGFRGHGTVDGVAADGLDWVRAFDNGSYLSPLLYTVDLLHAMQALPTLAAALPGALRGALIDPRRIVIGGYSQGGDVALTALAVASSARQPLHAAAGVIWAGCFAGRLEQARFYGGIEGGPEALADPSFLHVMPSWWKPAMYRGGVAAGIAEKHRQLLQTLRASVESVPQPLSVASLEPLLARLDAFDHPQFLRAPLQLHHSDQDHYSPPAWNQALARRVVAAGGAAEAHLYRGNNHGFQVEAGWSPAGSTAGRALSIERALAFAAAARR